MSKELALFLEGVNLYSVFGAFFLFVFAEIQRGADKSIFYGIFILFFSNWSKGFQKLIDRLSKIQQLEFIDKSAKELILITYEEELFRKETGFKKFTSSELNELRGITKGKIDLRLLKKYQSYITHEEGVFKCTYSWLEKTYDIIMMVWLMIIFFSTVTLAYFHVIKSLSTLEILLLLVPFALAETALVVFAASFNWKRMNLAKIERVLNTNQ